MSEPTSFNELDPVGSLLNDKTDIIPLTHAPETINQKDYGISIGRLQRIPIGICSTAADEQVKVITSFLDNSSPFSETDITACVGRQIKVLFTNTNTANNIKLQVGTMDAYSIVATISTEDVPTIKANEYVMFTFTGTNWLLDKSFGGEGIVSLTQAEYDELSDEEKMKDVIYNITDDDSGVVQTTDLIESGNMNAVTSNAVSKLNGVVSLTKAEYEALSDEEKQADVIYNITDNLTNVTTVVDYLQSGNKNAVSSNAVYGALAEYGKDLLTGVSWESGYLTGVEDVTESPLGTQSTTQLEITSEAITVSAGTYRLSLFATKSSNYAFWLGVGEYLSDGTNSARPTLSDLSARSLIYEFVIPSTITQIKISYRSYDNILCKLEKIK